MMWLEPFGFGEILSEEGKKVMAMYSDIQTEYYRTLEEGENITFEIERIDGIPHARKIVRDPNLESEKKSVFHFINW